MATIFSIFARERLGYSVSLVTVAGGAEEHSTDTNLDTVFRKLSSCTDAL